MAYIHFIAFATVAVIILPTITMAADYIVGDGKGWNAGVDYQAWATDKVFRVGDRLVFDYKLPNSVHSVKEDDFNKCLASGGEVWISGHDIITLKTPGKRWYISSTGKRCLVLGQKMVIDVVDSDPSIPPVAPTPGPGTGRSKRDRRLFSKGAIYKAKSSEAKGRKLKWFRRGVQP
ncbi:hypothetical protein Tsubulata_012794 [Turnera subulata]|uniref:Phytocyanin domain-containing protein n=1 Tax=Turnera subulata TaxID=218843 RepID=A0A9Q0FPR9_9ROSI|nr:hypothetical protein Tsubulata_012794 [Turnera subulata]